MNTKPNERELSARENYEILKAAARNFELKKRTHIREIARAIIRDSGRNFRRSRYA